MRLHVDRVQNLTGFTVCNVPKDYYCWVLAASSVTSDEPEFYRYIEQLSSIFLNGEGYRTNVNTIHNFLILIHRDLSADIYINDFLIEIEMLSKRSVQAGTVITDGDIADIRQVRFPEINTQNSDQVICCFKVGWKFGLYFNFLGQNEVYDVQLVQSALGRLYRYLSFQSVYQSLESETHFRQMVNDGWFPFIEILGEEYKTLALTYQNEKFTYDDTVRELLDKFDEARVKRMTEKWWTKPSFQKKQLLLQAGIDAFLQRNDNGNINCIKNLYTEAEGIMRLLYFEDTGKSNRISLEELIRYIGDLAEKRTAGDGQSLLLPQEFLAYLRTSIFANFDLETNTVDLSKHSVGHGAAVAEVYTPERALQALLTLDQIYFCLPSPPNEAE